MNDDVYKNTVSAINQLADNDKICGETNIESSFKVLFVGNSITRHGPSQSIGWNNDFGMAASSIENDYVHLVMKKISKKIPDAAFMIAQISEWETEYYNDEMLFSKYLDAKNYNPDLIVIRLGENIKKENISEYPLEPKLVDMINYFKNGRNVKTIVTTCFWENKEKDDALRNAANATGSALVEIGDISDYKETMAFGKFEHKGVAMHPGDLGMKMISERILEAVNI